MCAGGFNHAVQQGVPSSVSLAERLRALQIGLVRETGPDREQISAGSFWLNEKADFASALGLAPLIALSERVAVDAGFDIG